MSNGIRYSTELSVFVKLMCMGLYDSQPFRNTGVLQNEPLFLGKATTHISNEIMHLITQRLVPNAMHTCTCINDCSLFNTNKNTHLYHSAILHANGSRSRGYKTFFMLNSAEHKI